MVKIIKMVLLCVFVLLIARVVFTCFVLQSWNENEMSEEEIVYLQMIKNIETETFEAREIFQFDWDRAYVQKERIKEEEFDQKLGFITDIGTLEIWGSYPFRVVFALEDEVVYDYHFDKNYLDFAQSDLLIYPETKFIKEDKKPLILVQVQ